MPEKKIKKPATLQGVAFFAVAVGNDTAAPNVSMLIEPAGPKHEISAMEASTPEELATEFNATVLSMERIDIAGVEGLLTVVDNPGPPGRVEQHLYDMVTDSTAYRFAFTSVNPSTDRETFAAVMETFRILDS